VLLSSLNKNRCESFDAPYVRVHHACCSAYLWMLVVRVLHSLSFKAIHETASFPLAGCTRCVFVCPPADPDLFHSLPRSKVERPATYSQFPLSNSIRNAWIGKTILALVDPAAPMPKSGPCQIIGVCVRIVVHVYGCTDCVM